MKVILLLVIIGLIYKWNDLGCIGKFVTILLLVSLLKNNKEDGQTYIRINSLDELTDSNDYLLIYHADSDFIILPEVVEHHRRCIDEGFSRSDCKSTCRKAQKILTIPR